MRFPSPADAYEDDYGDSVLLSDGTVSYSNWFTTERVPPGRIQVRSNVSGSPFAHARRHSASAGIADRGRVWPAAAAGVSAEPLAQRDALPSILLGGGVVPDTSSGRPPSDLMAP